jgi:hypothetical protein
MSDTRLPDPESFSRRPGAMGSQQDADGVGNDGGGEGSVSVEQALAEAKAAREAADRRAATDRAAAEEANRQRDAALGAAASANAGALSAREQAIEAAIAGQTNIVAQAKEQIALAQANGDPQAVADAMERMADAKAELKLLGGQKQYLASEKQRQPERQQQQRQQAPQGHTVHTPGGQMANVADAAKQWMDNHDRFYTDPAYYNHAVAAHSTITADGIQEGTPAYFRALDDAMTRFERYEAFERGELQHDGGRQQMNDGGRVDPYAQQRVPQPRQSRGPSASSVGAPPSRGPAPPASGHSNSQIDPMMIARYLGPNVTIDDLREGARFAGYSRGRPDPSRIDANGRAANFASDEEAYQSYLRAQKEIMDMERRGEDTGLKYGDTVYR